MTAFTYDDSGRLATEYEPWGAATRFAYGIATRLRAEYNAAANHLRPPRVVMDARGSVVARRDYRQFGA